jgi:Protein of unknown function DUF262/Protein of unknown function (DUF1524)
MKPSGTATEATRHRNDEPSTFESIFFPNGEALAVRVPDYQRAFAWDKVQIDLFIRDLEEYATKTGYYFGHFIMETKSEGPWEVVDGQQRLTTFVLFLMVCRVLSSADSHDPAFGMADKFSTVSYDAEALKTIAGNLKGYLDASDSFDAEKPPADEQIAEDLGLSRGTFTSSQRRMVFALLRFRQAFQTQELKSEKITSYIGVVMKSLCSHHLTRDKAVAVSIFEMHNTRGIPLSPLEIVKAKLMKFVYDHAGPERDSKVEQIQREFGAIYRMEEQLSTRSFRGKMTMEHLLRLHFRVVDDGSKSTEEDFHSPPNSATGNDLVAYLETMLHFMDSKRTTGRERKSGVEYAVNLATEFKKSVLIVSKTLPDWDAKNGLVGDVLILEPNLSCQFFLIIGRLMESSPDKADSMLRSELLSQWEKLLFTRDFHERYYNLKGGRDNFPALFQECRAERENIAQVIQRYLANGFRAGRTTGLQKLVREHLRDHRETILNNAFYWHWRWLPKLKYAIYKYEVRDIPAIREVMKGIISVEHILPQEREPEWVEKEDVPPRTLSESEREAVQKEVGSYVNGIGNLLLLTPGENTAEGNKHPAKKEYKRYSTGGSYKWHDENREKWRSSTKWRGLILARGKEIFDFMLSTLVDGSESPRG